MEADMRTARNTLSFLLVLLVGLVLGGILGELLKDVVPILAYGKSIGFQPVTVDLSVIKLTLGLTMQVNLAAIIGIVAAVFIFKKL